MTNSKTLALLLIASFIGADANAVDWRRVGEPTDGSSKYLDVDSPRRAADGDVVAQTLFEYPSEQRTTDGKVYRSSIRVTRFDCAGERIADQVITYFSGPAAGGAVVSRMKRSATEARAALEATDAQSTGKILLYAACSVYERGKPGSK
jgi:hypothetical protein